MMIRYFATTAGDTGKVALHYLKSLLRVGHVRLVGLPVLDLQGAWMSCAALTMTTLSAAYVNVVCTTPDLWVREQVVQMPNLDERGNVVSMETARGTSELYTQGVRNVLLAASYPPPPGPMMATAIRYEAVVVPTLDLAQAWHRANCHPRVLPVPVNDHGAMRMALAP